MGLQRRLLYRRGLLIQRLIFFGSLRVGGYSLECLADQLTLRVNISRGHTLSVRSAHLAV
jgi:hypothetical protein